MEASDQGEPEKTAKSRVVVVFRRDKDPRIDNLPRTQSVSENAANDSQVYDVNGRDDDRQVSHSNFQNNEKIYHLVLDCLSLHMLELVLHL